MTGPEALTALRELAGRHPLWGILDGAQDPRIAHWIRSGDVPWGCLYAGELPKELIEVAPYLVRLDGGKATPARLFEHGWSKSWGIYFTSAAPLDELRRHFRRYLRVTSEDRKRTMLLRFYDPRVLRIFLPTCTPRELAAFFGPAGEIFLERGAGFDVAEAPRGQLALHPKASP